MALLTKKILPEGKYRVSSNKGRISREFKEDYLQKVAKTSNDMIGAGLMIPASFKHRKDAIPRTQQEWETFEKEIEVNKPADPLKNAGYWKKFWVAPDEKGKPSLYGQIDAPGEVDQQDSMAWRLNNVNKEVSVSITENFEDGAGRTWTDGILHAAVVNHAVVADQTPFEENVTIVNMSMEDSEDSSEGLISELVSVLQKYKISLPASTSSKTFLRDLLIAAMQKPEGMDGDDLTPAPIYMSIEGDNMPITEAQAKALVATKAVNPDTNKPFTMEDLGFKAATPTNVNLGLGEELEKVKKENEKLRLLSTAFMKNLGEQTKAAFQARINALIGKGFDKDFIEKTIQPQIATVELSINPDGSIAQHPLEVTLSALESLPAPTKGSSGNPGQVEDNPFFSNPSDTSDSKIDEWLDGLEKDSGIRF